MKQEVTSTETSVSILRAAVISGAMVIGFLLGFSLVQAARSEASHVSVNLYTVDA